MDNVRALLAEQFRDEAPSSDISVSRAIADGRAAIRHRRIAASVSAAFAVTLVAVSATWLGQPPSPAVRPAASATPEPSRLGPHTPPPVPPGAPGAGNVPLLTGTGMPGGPAVIHLPGRGTVTVPIASGTAIQQVYRVPSGWVYTLSTGENLALTSLWFLPNDGTPRKIADGYNFAVSEGGAALAVIGSPKGASADVATEYSLPSLTEIRHTTVDIGGDPTIWTFADDLVLIGDQHPHAPPSTRLWNVDTGQVTLVTNGGNTWNLGISRDGRMLRRVDQPDNSGGRAPACFTVVTPGQPVPPDSAGHCVKVSGSTELAGWFSPTGDWVVLNAGEVDVARTTDLNQGRWAPIAVGALSNDTLIMFWDTDTTFVATGGAGYERCSVNGRCTALTSVPDQGEPVWTARG